MMRKVMAGLMMAGALVALAACGGEAPASEGASAGDAAGAAEAAEASASDQSVAELKGSLGALAVAAADVAGDAAKVAGNVIDTSTACQLAGQSPQVCGCVAEALGPRLTAETVGTLTGVLRTAVAGDVQSSVASIEGIDPQARSALTECLVRGAVQGAVAEAAGQ